MTPHFLGPRPNSYTFTKSIAEFVVSTEGKGLPRIIIRPSIISSVWKEPIPGWTDNANGPSSDQIAVFIVNGLSKALLLWRLRLAQAQRARWLGFRFAPHCGLKLPLFNVDCRTPSLIPCRSTSWCASPHPVVSMSCLSYCRPTSSSPPFGTRRRKSLPRCN